MKTPRRPTPYNNYKSKFVEMQKKDTTVDWYVFNDGTPYISQSERELREENHHRKRGGMDQGSGHKDFINFCGKRSAMKLPDKYGIAANGKYYGKVNCSSQLDQVDGVYHDKVKFVGKGGKGWTYNGDRQKPYWAERKGRYREGYSKSNGRKSRVGWD